MIIKHIRVILLVRKKFYGIKFLIIGQQNQINYTIQILKKNLQLKDIYLI